MVRRIRVAHDAINLPEAINKVVIRSVLPDVFEQSARVDFDGGIVVGCERQHVALGSVKDDADRLATNLFAAAVATRLDQRRLIVRKNVIAARVILGYEVRQDACAVAVAFVSALLLDEPNFFGTIIRQVLDARLGDECILIARRIGIPAVALTTRREINVDAAYSPDGGITEAEDCDDARRSGHAVQQTAHLVATEKHPRGETGFAAAQESAPLIRGGRQGVLQLAADVAVQPEV